MKGLFLASRVIFGGFFLYNGVNHLIQHKTLAQHAQSKRVPAPDLAVVASGVALLAGGASILSGVKPRLGAAALAGFLASVSPVMHDFWNAQDPKQRMDDMINFSKNIALLGGALALLSLEEPWPVSVPVAQPSNLERVTKAGKKIAA